MNGTRPGASPRTDPGGGRPVRRSAGPRGVADPGRVPKPARLRMRAAKGARVPARSGGVKIRSRQLSAVSSSPHTG